MCDVHGYRNLHFIKYYEIAEPTLSSGIAHRGCISCFYYYSNEWKLLSLDQQTDIFECLLYSNIDISKKITCCKYLINRGLTDKTMVFYHLGGLLTIKQMKWFLRRNVKLHLDYIGYVIKSLDWDRIKIISKCGYEICKIMLRIRGLLRIESELINIIIAYLI